MPRKSSIIIYPKLCDKDGDLSKKWYVEYQYRVPNNNKPFRFRIYEGLSDGSAEHRRQAAQKIILEKTEWLKSGRYLVNENTAPVYADELSYRNEARFWAAQKENPQMKLFINEYLNFAKKEKQQPTFINLQGKMRLFVAWLEHTGYINEHPAYFKRENIINFINDIVEKNGLSKVTVKKYTQMLRWLFDFFIEKEYITKNPVYKLSDKGVQKDCAAQPFSILERQMLKNAIENENPQLWLACQIQFYCAIRPNEMRLMKVSWIDFDNKQLRVPCETAKNRTTEFVDIPDILLAELLKHNLHRCNKDFFIFGKNGQPDSEHWGKNHFRNYFNKYRKMLNIPADRKFYSWKHTGAITLIQNGAQPYDLMEHLRHKDFSTTEKYLKKRVKNPLKRIDKFVSEI
jgi:integrase